MLHEKSQKLLPLLFIAAMELEVKPLLEWLGLQRVRSGNLYFYHGFLDKQSLLVLISGIGKKEAHEAALWAAEQKPELVVNVGFAGGISSLLSVGDLFLPLEIRNVKGNRIPCYPFFTKDERVVKGVLLTADSMVGTREKKKSLSGLADAVDMESFAIASVMQEQGIPFQVIRIVSDTANESFPLDFNVALKDGKIVPWKVLGPILRKPRALPAMIKLGFRSSRLAKRLCDFVLSYLQDAKSRV